MVWTNPLSTSLVFAGEISNYDEKLAVARKIAAKAKDGDIIGAGSGSTAFITLQEIARRTKDDGLQCMVIPTSREIEMSASVLGVGVTSLNQHKPDWCYDGADEVDPEGNLIKGRGGAMYREKLVMRSAEKAYILVDSSKFVDQLGQSFAVPVEIDPNALHLVECALIDLGATDIEIRLAGGKDGPVITESGGLILDVTFKSIDNMLEKNIKSITGVIESGLFWGYGAEIITV